LVDVFAGTGHEVVSGHLDVASKWRVAFCKSVEYDMLANWAVKMAKIGYGRTRQQICEMVKLLDKDNRPNPFTDNLPGKDWWYAFLRRHPKISMGSPEPLQLAPATACT